LKTEILIYCTASGIFVAHFEVNVLKFFISYLMWTFDSSC